MPLRGRGFEWLIDNEPDAGWMIWNTKLRKGSTIRVKTEAEFRNGEAIIWESRVFGGESKKSIEKGYEGWSEKSGKGVFSVILEFLRKLLPFL